MDRMPPPGLTVVIGAHPKGDMPKDGRMPPPGMPKSGAMGEGGKASPEEAGVIRSDQKCIDCANYDATSGDCAKVSGSFDPGDSCMEYFEAINSDEPDEDDMGGKPDGDMDDQQEMPAA